MLVLAALRVGDERKTGQRELTSEYDKIYIGLNTFQTLRMLYLTNQAILKKKKKVLDIDTRLLAPEIFRITFIFLKPSSAPGKLN